MGSIIGKTFDKAQRIGEKKGYVVNWYHFEDNPKHKIYFTVTGGKQNIAARESALTQKELLKTVRKLR